MSMKNYTREDILNLVEEEDVGCKMESNVDINWVYSEYEEDRCVS